MTRFWLAVALSLLAVPALAQTSGNPYVVTSCGAQSYRTGTYASETIDTSGNLCTGASVTPSGTQDTNLKQVNGATVNIGTGAAGTGTQRVTTSTDSTIGTVTAVTAITNALPAGSNIVGNFRIDQTTPGTTNGVVINSGSVTANNPLGITPTDRTITSATGSSQTVMASNAVRHSLIVQNTGNANCGINPTGGTAVIGGAGTLTLLPSGSYQPSIPTLSAVTAICTSGQPLYAEEN